LSMLDANLHFESWGMREKNSEGQGMFNWCEKGRFWCFNVAAANICKVGAFKLILVDDGAQTSGQNEMGGTTNHVSMDGNDEDAWMLAFVLILV